MTHLIIHNKLELRRIYLLEEVNQLLEKEYTQLSQLHNNPDIHIIEAPEHTKLGIDEVKLIQKEMIFQPFEGKYQIGIIFHAQNLTPQAQNAILKTLEEQTDSTIFYLEVNNEKNLLPTILSRSVKHYIKDEREKVEEEEFEKPAILDLELPEQFKEIDDIINRAKEEPSAISDLMRDLQQYYREELAKAINSGDENSASEITRKIDIILEAQNRMNANVNKKLALENLILECNQ